jgi:Uma2 family endonuclease
MTSPPVAVPPGRPAPPPTPVTFEEFLAWTDEDTLAEWVEGEIVPLSPTSFEHQLLLGFLYELIVRYVRARQLGTVILPPFLMRLPTRPSGREPDLVFVSNAHAERLRQTYVDGPADLVVEIMSGDSEARDRGEKFVEYEAARIPEYWLIDPLRRDALFYQLDVDGRYQRAAIDQDGFYRSLVLPGFRLQVSWLWQRPLPAVAEISAEL